MTDIRLYETRRGDAKFNAQANLKERGCHYVDDDTLTYHKARIISTHVVGQGWLLALVESVARNRENTQRGFRYVVFDVGGRVVSHVPLDDCFKTRGAATEAMWRYLDGLDVKAIANEALDWADQCHTRMMADMQQKLAKADFTVREG